MVPITDLCVPIRMCPQQKDQCVPVPMCPCIDTSSYLCHMSHCTDVSLYLFVSVLIRPCTYASLYWCVPRQKDQCVPPYLCVPDLMCPHTNVSQYRCIYVLVQIRLGLDTRTHRYGNNCARWAGQGCQPFNCFTNGRGQKITRLQH